MPLHRPADCGCRFAAAEAPAMLQHCNRRETVNLCDVFAERAEATLDLGKFGPLNTTYDPQFYTPELEACIVASTADGAKLHTAWLVDTIHDLIKKWDLIVTTEEDSIKFEVAIGEPVPLTKKALAKIPSAFLAIVFTAFTSLGAAKNATSSES